jgi:hypothetical protein
MDTTILKMLLKFPGAYCSEKRSNLLKEFRCEAYSQGERVYTRTFLQDGSLITLTKPYFSVLNNPYTSAGMELSQEYLDKKDSPWKLDDWNNLSNFHDYIYIEDFNEYTEDRKLTVYLEQNPVSNMDIEDFPF